MPKRTAHCVRKKRPGSSLAKQLHTMILLTFWIKTLKTWPYTRGSGILCSVRNVFVETKICFYLFICLGKGRKLMLHFPSLHWSPIELEPMHMPAWGHNFHDFLCLSLAWEHMGVCWYMWYSEANSVRHPHCSPLQCSSLLVNLEFANSTAVTCGQSPRNLPPCASLDLVFWIEIMPL